MVGSKSRVDRAHFLETSQKRSRHGQQHQGNSDLRHHQSRSQPCVACAPVPVRVLSFKLSVRFVRKAAKAGARLQKAPVASARNRAKAATVASMVIESTRGMESGSRLSAVRITTAANANPTTPPARLISNPSQTDSRTIAPERAPRASRTAYSRRRRMARTKSSPAVLTHAMSNTTETARNNVRSNGRTSSTSNSLSSATSPLMWIAAMLAGKPRMMSANAVSILRRLGKRHAIL